MRGCPAFNRPCGVVGTALEAPHPLVILVLYCPHSVSEGDTMPQFDGEVAIVTGGNSGIGAATARLFAREGARVVIAARNQERGDQVVREIVEAGGEAVFIQTDVSREAQIEACVRATLEHYARIDIVFNNAGIGGGLGGWSEPTESWQQMLDTTITGIYQMCKRVVPHMEAQGGGAIVNMSSIAAEHHPMPSTTPSARPGLSYNVAKGAAEAYTRALAVEAGVLNIRVNCVRPSWIETPMTTAGHRRTKEVAKPSFQGRQALKTTGQPEDVAHAVVFLASPAARFITG